MMTVDDLEAGYFLIEDANDVVNYEQLLISEQRCTLQIQILEQHKSRNFPIKTGHRMGGHEGLDGCLPLELIYHHYEYKSIT